MRYEKKILPQGKKKKVYLGEDKKKMFLTFKFQVCFFMFFLKPLSSVVEKLLYTHNVYTNFIYVHKNLTNFCLTKKLMTFWLYLLDLVWIER